jgi:hypothetical protein
LKQSNNPLVIINYNLKGMVKTLLIMLLFTQPNQLRIVVVNFFIPVGFFLIILLYVQIIGN